MSDIAVRQDVNWVLKVVLGTGVPEVDTDGLTRAAQQLTSAADEMTGDWASLLTAARQTAIAYSGQAAETMRTAVADLESFRLQIARTLQGLAEGVRASADEVDYSTLAITIQAALLLGEISVEMAMAPFTAGASLDEVPEQIAEAQSLIRTILSKLLELLKQLLHAVGVNAGSGVAADAVAQLAQIGSGHRSTFDVLQTLQTAAFAAWAALFGAAAGPGGRQLGKFLASLGRAGLPKAFADGIGMVLDHTFGDGTESGVGGELGAAVGRYLSSGGGQDAAKALDREFHEALGKRLPADAGAGFTHGLARDLALATHRALESGATAEHGVGPVLRANITDVLNAYLPRWVEDRQKAALAPGIAKAGAGLEHSVADTFSKRALHAVGDNVAMGASILPGETSYQAMTGQPVSVNWYDPVSGAVGGQLTHTLTDAAQTIARRRNSMDGMPADAPPTDVAAPDIAAADSAGAKPRVTVETRPAAAAGSGATRGAVPSGRGPAARRSPEEPEITVAVGIAREKPLPGLPGDASAVPVRGEAGAGSDSDRTVSASAHVAADESRPRTVRPETARPDTPAASPTASQAKPGTPAAPPTPGRRVPAGPPAGTGRVARTAVTVRGDQVEVGGIPHSAADLAAKLTAAGTARHVVVLDHDSRGDQPVLARFAADLARRTGLDVVVPQFPLKTWHDGTAAGTIRVDSTGTPRPKPVEGRWTRHSPGGADGSGSPDGTAVKFVADFATATRERPPAGSADAAVPGPDSPVAAARNRGAARDLTTATEFARPPDDPHHWEHQAAKDAARLQVTEFADPAAAASFLARFGVGYGHTLHLREGRDRDTVGDEAAARNMLADATGRITVAAHGDGEHLLVGGYALAPEGLGQVLQAHPDWEAIRRFGVRLAVCDAGAPVVTSRPAAKSEPVTTSEPADDRRPYAQRLADALGVNVLASTAKTFSSRDGHLLAAAVDPDRPHLLRPQHGAAATFHDFVPAGSPLDRPRVPDTDALPLSTRGRVTRRNHPRWDPEDVVRWSPPYRPATSGDPLLPWYLRRPGVDALGEAELLQVFRSADAHGHALALVNELNEAGARADAQQVLTPKQGLAVRRLVADALDSVDPEEWTALFRSGITWSDGGTLVRIRFRLEHGTEAPEAPDPDPVVDVYATRYGDVSFSHTTGRAASHRTSQSGNFFVALGGIVAAVIPVVKIGLGRDREPAHAVGHEVQLGLRATTGARVGVRHRVAVDADVHRTGQAPVGARLSVPDKALIASHPAAYGAGEPSGGPMTEVRDPGAIDWTDNALQAIDPRPVQDAFLQAAAGSGGLSGRGLRHVVEAVTTELLDAKSIRDRAAQIMAGGLVSNFTTGEGFSGYVRLRGRVLRVEHVGTARDGMIRNDIAETMTVAHTTGHSHDVSIQVGAELPFAVGVTAGLHVGGSLGGARATTSQRQGQQKQMVGHGGPLDRFSAVIEFEGVIESDPRMRAGWPPSTWRRPFSAPSVTFTARTTGEIMMPAHQSADFLRRAAQAPPAAPAAAGAELTREGARRLVEHFGPGARGLPPAHPAVNLLRSVSRSLHRRAALRSGTADPRFESPDALMHSLLHENPGPLRQQIPTALHIPAGSPILETHAARLRELLTTTAVRVFQVSGDDHGTFEELVLQGQPPVVARRPSDRNQAFAYRRGYVLSDRELSHAWSGPTGVSAVRAPDPARPGAGPVPAWAPRWFRRAAPQPQPAAFDWATARSATAEEAIRSARPERTLWVTPPAVGPGGTAAVQRAVDARPELVSLGHSDQTDLLRLPNLPDQGFVMNPAGRAVVGWRASGHAWQGPADTRSDDALRWLLRQAGNGGVQLVVPRAGEFRTMLSEAVAELRAADGHDAEAAAQWRLDLQQRFGRAAEGNGSLAGLGHADLVRMLVSDRGVRIVHEDGSTPEDLNDRRRFGRRRSTDGAPAAAVSAAGAAVDLTFTPRREYAVRADGGILEQITPMADAQGRVQPIPSVRRAVSEYDVRRETPELVSGTGLGSAAIKELPGAELLQTTARALLVALTDDHAGAVAAQGPDILPGVKSRWSRLPARVRRAIDEELAAMLGAPQQRAGRGAAGGASTEIRITSGNTTYRISAQRVRTGRRPKIRTESPVQVGHQVKGTVGGQTSVTRTRRAGIEGSAGARFELGGWALDLAGVGGGASAGRNTTAGNFTGSKVYSRKRAAPDAAAPADLKAASRVDYDMDVHLTVSRTTAPLIGRPHTRTARRIIPVVVPALVHHSLRPDDAHLAGPAGPGFRQATADAVLTVGRPTELGPDEHAELGARRLPLAATGVDGLHVTLAGLDRAVAAVTTMVRPPAADGRRPTTPDPALHPASVAEIERLLSEGMQRANLPRLLSAGGLTIPLPGEFHHNPAKPDIDHSVTVTGFLLAADPRAAHSEPQASAESYGEHDIKASLAKGTEWNASANLAVGPVFQPGRPAAADTGSGPAAGESAPAGSSRRAAANQAGLTVSAEGGMILSKQTRTATQGVIDVSLLTEPRGGETFRAHLVLEVVSRKVPHFRPTPGRKAGRLASPGTFQAEEKTIRLLLENAAEVSMSRRLYADVAAVQADPRHFTPPPRAQQAFHAVRTDAVWGAGFVTHFDDSHAYFRWDGAREPLQHPGILHAIREGILRTGLTSADHLNAASDMWRGVAARFSPEELRTHAHDLLGVGVSHRADVEDKLGATRRITVTVRAESIHTEHLRTRAGDSVVFGGQALEQEGRYRTRGVSGSVGFAVGGKGVLPGAGFLEAEVKVGAEAGRAVTTGVQTVDRDIRRVQARTGDPGHPGAPGPGNGEELVHRLQLRIEIHTDTELPEPVADRLGGRPGTRRRRPEATLTTADVDIETAPESAGAAPDRRASHVSARSVVPRHFLEPGPPPGDPGTEPAQPDVIHRVRIVGAHRAEPGPLELFLARRFQGVAFPGLAGVAEWAPTATLARQTAHGHVHRVRGPAPAVPAGFEPTGDRGLDLQLSLAQRNVRNKVDALFNGTLNLLPTSPGPALFLSARARVIRPAARPAGTPVRYFALGFPESATEHESNDKASRSLVREFTLSGGNSVAAGPNERRTALETITETAGGTGDYTERGRSHEQPNMEFELAVDVGIHGEDTALELSPLRKFTGLMPVRWAMEGHDLFPSRFAHPSSVTVQVDHQDLALSVQSASALAPDEGAIHLLADTHGPGLDADLASAARSVAVRTGRPVRLALVRHDGAGLETGLEYRLFDPDQAVHGAAEEAWAGYRLLAAAAEAESLAALDTARRLAAESAGRAVAAGQHFVDAAELRSSLPGTTTAAHAVDALWQATDSGFAIPAGHRDLALAQRAPAIRGTARLAVGGAIAADGGRTLRGLTLPRGELADAVAGRLIGLGPSLPAHVLVEGPDGAALAEAISRGHHTARHRTPPGTEAGGDSRIPPPITVIGTRAVAARGPGRIALTGWLAPLVNGFAPPRPGREGWAVYRDGVAVALSTRAARSRNATELIAALEPPESPGSPARRGRRPEGRTE